MFELFYYFFFAECNQLHIENLREIYEALFDARDKWYDIGMFLKLQIETLNGIENNEVQLDRQFRKMLLLWLQSGKNRTWYALADALRSKFVGRSDIAGKLHMMKNKVIH